MLYFMLLISEHRFPRQNMSSVIYQSSDQYGQCAQYLKEFSRSADATDVYPRIVTGAGTARVRMSRRVLLLWSPLLRDVVASLPATASQEQLAIIIPDTDAASVKKMMELLVSGQANVDTAQCREAILSLAECLNVKMEHLETIPNGKEVIRVKNMDELLERNINNNFTVARNEDKENTDMKEDNKAEVVPFACPVCGKKFDTARGRDIHHGFYLSIREKCRRPGSSTPSFPTMIQTALRDIGDRSGSSCKTILKYVCANYEVDTDTALVNVRLALKKMVASRELTSMTGSAFGPFKLTAEIKERVKSEINNFTIVDAVGECDPISSAPLSEDDEDKVEALRNAALESVKLRKSTASTSSLKSTTTMDDKDCIYEHDDCFQSPLSSLVPNLPSAQPSPGFSRACDLFLYQCRHGVLQDNDDNEIVK